MSTCFPVQAVLCCVFVSACVFSVSYTNGVKSHAICSNSWEKKKRQHGIKYCKGMRDAVFDCQVLLRSQSRMCH